MAYDVPVTDSPAVPGAPDHQPVTSAPMPSMESSAAAGRGDDQAEVRQFRFERPPGATTILLVRHGESVPARADRPFPLVDGHGDPELHPQGELQAAKVAERLSRPRRGEKISAVYVTNLRRTAQTAAPLCEALGLKPVVEADLREVFLGEWEGGVYRLRLREGGPIVDRLMTEGRWDVVPGAEPDDVFISRIRAGIGSIASAHPDSLVAAFTHGGVIGRIAAQAVGAKPMSFSGAENGSITELLVTQERWFLRNFNDTAHLEEI